MRHGPGRAFILVLLGLYLGAVSGCSGRPKEVKRQPSFAIVNGADSRLGKVFGEQLKIHPEKSGVFLLGDGLDAFVGRVLLAGKAERSIDLQYYMFHQDTVGRLLLRELLKAADRGVRVRLLIDDMYGSEADAVWTALDAHPHMEVRLFNPFSRGMAKYLDWITRFREVNYRMHSKSFTVDNQATIVGGRNIGDEYFEANPDLAFADLDVLAIGPVVPEVSMAFDQYWNSAYAYPAPALAGPATPEQLEELRKNLGEVDRNSETARYIEALRNSELARALGEDRARFGWAEAKVFHDSSEKKARGENWEAELLISQLWPYLEKVNRELIIISPYFVPGEKGTEALCGLQKKGADVRILTNSLASNDVSAVHAGYARYREKLLQCGVTLYELDEEIKKKAGEKYTWLPGLSKSSLHAKTMILDRKAMFVGSMNLDQRSLHINNEIGILFLEPEVSGRSARTFDQNIDQAAFRLTLQKDGEGRLSLRWHLKKDSGGEVVYDAEPYVGFWKKLGVWLVGLFPVEYLL